MGQTTCICTLEYQSSCVTPDKKSPNCLALSVEKKVRVTVYYLKDTGFIWTTAISFRIHQCAVSKTILEVFTAISTHLAPKYIHLPKKEDEMRAKVAEFEEIWHGTGVWEH